MSDLVVAKDRLKEVTPIGANSASVVRSLLLSPVLLLLSVSSLASQQRVFSISALPPVAEVNVTLAAQRTPHLFELRNFSAGAGPLMNLLDASNKQIARGVAKGNRVRFSVPGSMAGKFTLVVRSTAGYGETGGAVQTGELWIDGHRMKTVPQFSSGHLISLTGVVGREELVGISQGHGNSPHSAYVTSADGMDIIARERGVRTKLPLVEGQNVRIFFASNASGAMGVRGYWNDIGRDADGDGLGDSFERAIGTCSSRIAVVAGTNCAQLADTRDTDGDGLQDGWEVMGFDASWQDANGNTLQEHLPLPTWGADPRHKDIFIEVDFRRLTLEDNQNNLALMMSPAIARTLAATYGDSATTDGALRTQHAVSMGNPDGKPGISLHMDTGVPPMTPADSTIYGNWGGYNAVDAIPDGSGGYIPQTPGVWQQQMSPARRGIFHYVLAYTTGGGSCGQGIACGFNMASAGNSAHEFGHTLGLDHNGPYGTHEPNCKPNYPSLMNYAYVGGLKFSDGQQFGALNNHAMVETAAVDPAHRFLLDALRFQWAYKVDTLTGSVDWNRDNQFAPAGTTVRAYGNYQPGGAGCEFTREREHPLQMMSQTTPAIVNYKNHLWIFSVTLDGKLSYAYTPGAFVCAKVDDCPQLSFYPPTVKDVGGVDAVDATVITVNGRRMILIVGIRPDGTLFETWMEERNGLFVWNGPNTVPGSPAAGEPSLAASSNGSSVVLAYRGHDNVVRYRFRSPATFLAERTMSLGNTPLVISANASPSVAFTYLPLGSVVGREHLVSAVIDTNSVVQLYTPREFGTGWQRLGIPYDWMSGAVGKPSMAWVGPIPGSSGVGATTAMSRTRLPRTRPTVAPASGGVLADPGSVLLSPDPITIGRFYIVYRQRDATVEIPNPDAVKMQMSYVDRSGRYRIGVGSYFDNVWSYAFGIDLLQPGEMALRSVQSYSIPNAGAHPNSLYSVLMRPHADGISNLSYINYDDWKVIAWGSCATLSAVQNAAMKVSCAPKSW